MLASCNDLSKPDVQVRDKLACLDSPVNSDEAIPNILRRPSELGELIQGKNKHFYSSGAFNLIQLILYILNQTGPAQVFLSTYSIGMDSIATLIRKKDTGTIKDIRFLIDNRVRSISPKPFDYLLTSFPGAYRCCALHAKVALIWNEQWSISVVGSQNATHNPKIERGIIHTDKTIFDFDLKVLEDEFNNGTT